MTEPGAESAAECVCERGYGAALLGSAADGKEDSEDEVGERVADARAEV